MSHVFISFASEDLALADRMLAALEAGGIRCWIAHRDIPPAASYPAAISQAVESSHALLLLLTASADRSPHVLREVEMAFNSGVRRLAVRIGRHQPSANLLYFLSTTQWLDTGDAVDDEDLARIESAMRRLVAGATGDTGWRERDGQRDGAGSTRWWVLGGVVAAVVAALAAFLLSADFSAPPRDEAAAPPASAAARAGPGAPEPMAPMVPPVQPRTRDNPRDGATYVWVPAGSFTMGCSAGDPDCEEDERPAHHVRIEHGFWLGRTEVTLGHYAGRAAVGQVEVGQDASLPVTGVTWAAAKAYCTTIGGRLPSEAEWEYAARGGTTSRAYDELAAAAWFEANSDGGPKPVGLKSPNAFGLHDMLGNVAEWVRDRYYNAYDEQGGEIVEPLAPNATAVARGGSWFSNAAGVRVSRRLPQDPAAELPIVGFRCALDRL